MKIEKYLAYILVGSLIILCLLKFFIDFLNIQGLQDFLTLDILFLYILIIVSAITIAHKYKRKGKWYIRPHNSGNLRANYVGMYTFGIITSWQGIIIFLIYLLLMVILS